MMPVLVGSKLYGYCGGVFGRDHYDDCRVEAVGAGWVVVRCENGEPDFASGPNIREELAEHTTPEEER
jgi:hypothetical protein